MVSTLSFHQSTTLNDLQDLVVRVSRKHPALAERAMRASLLLAAGQVTPLGNGLFRVRGSDTYAVDADARTCSCPDFQHGAPEVGDSRYCKHLLAAVMSGYLGEKSIAREANRRSAPSAAPTAARTPTPAAPGTA